MTDREGRIKKRRVNYNSLRVGDRFNQDSVDDNTKGNVVPQTKKRISYSLNSKKSKYQKKYKSDIAKIDWDKAELETIDLVYPRRIEQEIQKEAEIGELLNIEENDDSSDWVTENEEENEDEMNNEEQDGFMNLLSAINLRGVNLALNNARFPAMEQTALYTTGLLVKEYIRHLSENINEDEQDIEQVAKDIIEQHKPKMTFKDMDEP